MASTQKETPRDYSDRLRKRAPVLCHTLKWQNRRRKLSIIIAWMPPKLESLRENLLFSFNGYIFKLSLTKIVDIKETEVKLIKTYSVYVAR